MKRRVFRKTGEEISLPGFGCMRFPNLSEDKNDIDELKSETLLDYAYEQGVNYFDTAHPYHCGLSEAFTGRVLSKYPRVSPQTSQNITMEAIILGSLAAAVATKKPVFIAP